MANDFSLVKDCDYYIFRRLKYPRFEALIDLKNPLPEIKEIRYFEYCSAAELENVMKDVGIYFKSINLVQDEY